MDDASENTVYIMLLVCGFPLRRTPVERRRYQLLSCKPTMSPPGTRLVYKREWTALIRLVQQAERRSCSGVKTQKKLLSDLYLKQDSSQKSLLAADLWTHLHLGDNNNNNNNGKKKESCINSSTGCQQTADIQQHSFSCTGGVFGNHKSPARPSSERRD